MRSSPAVGLVLAAAVALLGGPPGSAHAEGEPQDPYDRVLADFRKGLKKGTVDGSIAAVQLLDPNNPRSLPPLLSVLSGRHWMVRGTAMEALSTIEAGPLRSELRLHLVTDEDPWIREGIAFAVSLAPVAGDADALVGAMDDPAWRVRRSAARGLGEIISRDGAERLVEALETESDLRVKVWVRASLRSVVGKDLGRDTARWREWWERHKDKPEWKKQGEEVLRKDFAGVPLETITVGGPAPKTTGEGKKRKEPPEVFVLAPFGFTHDWYRPYLDEAAQFVRLTYVTLPTVEEITGRSGFGSAIPKYPVTKLAKALDSLRKEKGKEKVVILCAGPVGWIAEKYALKYPDHTAAMVIVNGWLDVESYAAALMRLANNGNRSEKWAAGLLMGRIPRRHDEIESRKLRRVFLSHFLSDRRDSEAYRLWKAAMREHGFVTVPDLKFDRHKRIHTPTLFYFPGDSPFGGASDLDLRRIRQSFRKPPPVIAVMRDSRGLSHVEDPVEFLRVLRGFLRLSGIID